MNSKRAKPHKTYGRSTNLGQSHCVSSQTFDILTNGGSKSSPFGSDTSPGICKDEPTTVAATSTTAQSARRLRRRSHGKRVIVSDADDSGSKSLKDYSHVSSANHSELLSDYDYLLGRSPGLTHTQPSTFILRSQDKNVKPKKKTIKKSKKNVTKTNSISEKENSILCENFDEFDTYELAVEPESLMSQSSIPSYRQAVTKTDSFTPLSSIPSFYQPVIGTESSIHHSSTPVDHLMKEKPVSKLFKLNNEFNIKSDCENDFSSCNINSTLSEEISQCPLSSRFVSVRRNTKHKHPNSSDDQSNNEMGDKQVKNNSCVKLKVKSYIDSICDKDSIEDYKQNIFSEETSNSYINKSYLTKDRSWSDGHSQVLIEGSDFDQSQSLFSSFNEDDENTENECDIAESDEGEVVADESEEGEVLDDDGECIDHEDKINEDQIDGRKETSFYSPNTSSHYRSSIMLQSIAEEWEDSIIDESEEDERASTISELSKEEDESFSFVDSPTCHKSQEESFYDKLACRSICEDVHISAGDKVLSLCNQTEFIGFSTCISQRMMSECIKIGEGVYGEVFRSVSRGHGVAIKIVPIEGNFEVNDCPQKKFEEILPEVVIATELSDLAQGTSNRSSCFCQVNRISCVQGSFPHHLLSKWDDYAKRKRSENDRPDMFPEDQLFMVFEFADGGSALENFKFANHTQAFSALRQVVFALAVAESALEFEHRDLHIGNVLVKDCKEDTVSFVLEGDEKIFLSEGVFATVIDFTISRLKKDGCAVFCDISTDDLLFEGSGDIQFDVYREMKQENNNDWSKFCPRSNVRWVKYVCEKFNTVIKYKDTGRGHREAQRRLRHLSGVILDYRNCVDLAKELSLWVL